MVLGACLSFELCHWLKTACLKSLGLPCFPDQVRAQKNVSTKPTLVHRMIYGRPGGMLEWQVSVQEFFL